MQLLTLKEILPQKAEPYYQSEDAFLLHGDAFGLLKKIKTESIEMIFADPPYFLSNGGITCRSGKMASVNKASWDEQEEIFRKEKEAFRNQKEVYENQEKAYENQKERKRKIGRAHV